MFKLSIIIPVYNCAKYLSCCLDSIIKTKKDVELILIDDGSTDNSLDICNKYAKNDYRITVYHKENGGVSSARNLGLRKAKGDYIMFVDGDDMLSEKWDRIFSYVKNDDVYYFYNINKDIKKEKLLEYICGVAGDICLAGPYSKIVKRKVVIDNNIFFDESIINGEDMLFNVRLLHYLCSFKIINYNYYYYRQIVGQSTKKYSARLIQSDIEFHKILDRILSDYDVDSNIIKKIKVFSLENAIIMILNRMSYAKCFNYIRDDCCYFEKPPYYAIIYKCGCDGLKSILFFCLRHKKYRLIYYVLKVKNKIMFWLNRGRKGQFIKI